MSRLADWKGLDTLPQLRLVVANDLDDHARQIAEIKRENKEQYDRIDAKLGRITGLLLTTLGGLVVAMAGVLVTR